jgi:hypothetical protein
MPSINAIAIAIQTDTVSNTGVIPGIIAAFKARGGDFEAEACLRAFLNKIV